MNVVSSSKEVATRLAELLPGALAAAGMAVSMTRVVRVRMPSAAHRRAFLAGVGELSPDALIHSEEDQTVAILCDPLPDCVATLGGLAEELGLREIGIGSVTRVEETARGHIEAIHAQTAAKLSGATVSEHTQRNRHLQDLLLHVDHARLRAFSDGVLAPMDAHDQAHPKQELRPTLRAFFEALGSIEATAGALLVHRHTIRSRLRRISELCGYDVTVAGDYLELWLAVELRDALERGRP